MIDWIVQCGLDVIAERVRHARSGVDDPAESAGAAQHGDAPHLCAPETAGGLRLVGGGDVQFWHHAGVPERHRDRRRELLEWIDW